MKNLNKFTKAELINKFKKLEDQNSNKNNIIKFLDYMLLFKNLIIKITLIGLIIRWIKKYSLLKKFWHIFSIISSTLLGFSVIDIYSWDVITWIKDTSIYNWYLNLFDSYKNELSRENNPPEFQKNRISEGSIKVTNGIQEEINSNNRQNNRNIIEEINNKQESLRKEYISNEKQLEDNNDKINYKKWILIGSIIIINAVIYYYFDDIKPAAGDAANTIIEKIKSSRSWFNNDESNNSSNIGGNNQMNIQTNINSDIQLSDNTQPVASSSRILTSPSLDNLNQQVETSWNESQPSSISSPDSDRTVTQSSISHISSLISTEWKGKLSEKINDKMNFIESCFNDSNNKLEDGIKLTDYFTFIVNEYNIEIQTYNFMKSDSTSYNTEILNNQKEWLYYFREWIVEYKNKIFPDSNVTIETGSINDSPKILSKNIV